MLLLFLLAYLMWGLIYGLFVFTRYTILMILLAFTGLVWLFDVVFGISRRAHA